MMTRDVAVASSLPFADPITAVGDDLVAHVFSAKPCFSRGI
jgi:hypothetical protein